MAITTIDGIIAGLQPTIHVYKAITAVAGRWSSQYYSNGFPAAGQAPSGIAGDALTSVTNQISFTNPVTGNTYLARMELVTNATSLGTIALCDRLWHNTGITVTSTAVQTINSTQFPSRDATGGTSGHGIMIAAEVTTTMGAGTPTFTMNYTATDGTTATTTTVAMATTMAASSFIPIPLASGHTGVQKVNWWQQSATMTSGAYSLVAYRVLGTLDSYKSTVLVTQDALQLGFPRLYDNTVPFIILKSSQTTGNGVMNLKLNYSKG